LLGSEIYQETLAKALAKQFGAKLMIIDSVLLPGVSFLDLPFSLVSSCSCFIWLLVKSLWFKFNYLL